LAVSHQAVRLEDAPQFFTLAGLAAAFAISEATVRKYIEWGNVPEALGKHPNGFNYDHTHYRALAAIRAERDAYRPLRERARQPRVIVIARRDEALV
jgi:hypothetical protein